MRKSVLVAAMVLVSAAAQADGLVSAVDPMWEPMPRGPEAKKAAGSQRRVVSRMARADVRRPHHQGWSAARIVATLHHYGIYW
jgi:hypothetical protein